MLRFVGSEAAAAQPIFYATHGVWNLIIQLGIIAALLLAANGLRRRIPLIRKSLMPVSVLAGFMMLALKLILSRGFGVSNLCDPEVLDTLV